MSNELEQLQNELKQITERVAEIKARIEDIEKPLGFYEGKGYMPFLSTNRVALFDPLVNPVAFDKTFGYVFEQKKHAKEVLKKMRNLCRISNIVSQLAPDYEPDFDSGIDNCELNFDYNVNSWIWFSSAYWKCPFGVYFPKSIRDKMVEWANSDQSGLEI